MGEINLPVREFCFPIAKGRGPRVVVGTAAFQARVGGSFPGLSGLKVTKMFLHHPLVKLCIVGSLRDRKVACSVSDLQGLNFESCVWRAVSSHRPQKVLLAQFSLYVHKGDLKPDSFHSPNGETQFYPEFPRIPPDLPIIPTDSPVSCAVFNTTSKVYIVSDH